ncbi:MAG: transcriptional regulator [Gammaproteobacteria bacterium]|nr:transcriptional regulator [Gammaproteobacteria bacterium]MDE2023780.1 transcriptional regulator [Gammaproteobacteria bacterium]
MTEPAKFTTTIQPWGNSLGLRITRPLGDMARLKKGSKVTIEVVEGGLLVKSHTPAKKRLQLPYTEAELVSGLTPSRAHADELPIPLSGELGP